jgi:hypothetical protein
LKTIEDQYAGTGTLKMSAIEEGLLRALMRDGCQILEAFFKQHVPDCADQRRDGERHYRQRHIRVHSVLGKFSLRRDYFYDGKDGRAPLDEQLGLKDGNTPGLQKLMSRAGAMSGSFEQGSDDLRAYSHLEVPGRSIQRMASVIGPDIQSWLQERTPTIPKVAPNVMYVSYDGTGVPTTKSETKGRKGKQPDGSSKGREVKLGCVFTQLRIVAGEPPDRDPDSTTYAASFDQSVDFGTIIRQEAILRGMASAEKVVVLGDGAPWIWEVARVNFPDAVWILDLYHAFEHVNELAALIYPKESAEKGHARKWRKWLKADKVDDFIKVVTELADAEGKKKRDILKALKYFTKNRSRMLYASFRKKGYFVGSGVVEAGCKTVVGKRAKQSGMFWHVEGAQNVLSSRCAVLGRLFDAYWDHRNAA